MVAGMSADERPRVDPAAGAAEVARSLRCRRCERVVASADQVFSLPGSPAVGAYANAFGLLREVVAVRDAEGLVLDAISSTELTWFAGYAWRIACCGGCTSHLGWRYEAVEPEREPAAFYGLLTAAVVEG